MTGAAELDSGGLSSADGTELGLAGGELFPLIWFALRRLASAAERSFSRIAFSCLFVDGLFPHVFRLAVVQT